jgi:hypothetical protein
MEKNGDKIAFYVKDIFWFNNADFYSKEIIEERLETKKTSWKSENEFVKEFLDWKRVNKPSALAKPYLKKIEALFDSVMSSWRKISIIAFRHWDKTIEWDLSDQWKQQASHLWNVLSQKENNVDRVVYISTHNTINESIIRTLITASDKELPITWEEPLNFTEVVQYNILPWRDGNDWLLEVQRRWLKITINYAVFKNILQTL